MAVIGVIGLTMLIVELAAEAEKPEDPTIRNSKSLFASDVEEHPCHAGDKQLHSEGVYPSKKDSFTKQGTA